MTKIMATFQPVHGGHMRCRVPVLLLAVLLWPATAGARLERPQVVGGQPVQSGQFPFIVALVKQGLPITLCTGSLIRNRWVLTAAHCNVQGQPATHVAISDMQPGVLGAGHTVSLIPVAEWIPHPQYNPATFANDIALIELTEDALLHAPQLNGSPLYTPSTVQLATAPANTSNSIGNVVIAGFGETDSLQAPPLVYWASAIPTFPAAVCDAVYQNPVTATHQLCFGTYPNACQGDSGGAVFRQSGGTFTQYGVVSFNAGAGTCGDFQSVATYVPAYVSWINQQIDPPAANPITHVWELPQPASEGVASGIANAQGWAFSRAGAISSVRFEWNGGQTLTTAPCCSPRGGIPDLVPGAPLNTGFSGVFNWANLPVGLHDVTLVIRDSAGNEVREPRTIRAVRTLNNFTYLRGFRFGPTTQCVLSGVGQPASITCSGAQFQEGTCNGKITLAWSDGKQAFEVVQGCH